MPVITLNQSNFKSTMENNHFVIVNFVADWCEPCKVFSNTFRNAALLHPGIVFGAVNTDENNSIAQFFNIEQIPAVLAIKDQVVIDGIIGVLPVYAFESHIQQWKNFDNTEINRHFSLKAPQI